MSDEEQTISDDIREFYIKNLSEILEAPKKTDIKFEEIEGEGQWLREMIYNKAIGSMRKAIESLTRDRDRESEESDRESEESDIDKEILREVIKRKSIETLRKAIDMKAIKSLRKAIESVRFYL